MINRHSRGPYSEKVIVTKYAMTGPTPRGEMRSCSLNTPTKRFLIEITLFTIDYIQISTSVSQEGTTHQGSVDN